MGEPIRMTVIRAGYWKGQYPQPGEIITVEDPELAKTLEIAGFATRTETPAAAPVKRTKGSPDDKR